MDIDTSAGFSQTSALGWTLAAIGALLAIGSGLTAWAALYGRFLRAVQRPLGRRVMVAGIFQAALATLFLYLGVGSLIGSPTNYFRVAQTPDNAVVPLVIAFAQLLVLGTALWPPLLSLGCGILLGSLHGKSRPTPGLLLSSGMFLGHAFTFWWPRPPLPADPPPSNSNETVEDQDYELTLASGEDVEAEEHVYIANILELGDTTARDVMHPRTDVVAIDIDWTSLKALETVADSRHSRFPVYEGSIDSVIGILHLRDLLEYLVKGDDPARLPLRELLLEPLFLPESKKADDALRLLQRSKSHLAIVLDEYGGTAGILTIEDLLEEIVGEIQDEHDDEAHLYYQKDDGAWVVNAQLSLEELNELVDTEIEAQDVDTLGGLVTFALGRIPLQGDVILLNSTGEVFQPSQRLLGDEPSNAAVDEERAAQLRLTVMSVERNRVGRVLVEKV